MRGGVDLVRRQIECEAYNCAEFASEVVGESYFCGIHARKARSLHTDSGQSEGED